MTSSEHTATNDTPLPAGARPGTEADPAEAATGLAEAAAAAIAERTGLARHDVAVVLGSGWRPAADVIGEAVAEVPMGELPGFAAPSVVGHGGTVRSATASGFSPSSAARTSTRARAWRGWCTACGPRRLPAAGSSC